MNLIGNALGNSIVAGLSSKSGNGQLSAKEQAALDQKMAAMDKKIQAKLNDQSGAIDPVIQMKSQNGVLVPQGSNPVEIFDWYQENGLLQNMDDSKYHELALAANGYEDKKLARVNASMNYSNYLDSKLGLMSFMSGQHKESNKNGRYQPPPNLKVQQGAQRHIEKIWSEAVKLRGSAVFPHGGEDEAAKFFAEHFTESSKVIGPRGFEIASVTVHDAKGNVVLLPPHTDGNEIRVDYLTNADAFNTKSKYQSDILLIEKSKKNITSIMHTHGIDRGGDNVFSLGDYEYYTEKLPIDVSNKIPGYLAAPNGQLLKFDTTNYFEYLSKKGGVNVFRPTYDDYMRFVKELNK